MQKRHTVVLALSLLCTVAAFGANGVVLSGQGPATTNNDDSCDIAAFPAATLLVPYFEVDLLPEQTTTTVFTITNVTRLPQIAHVTIWTDWSYPVLNFNIFLTGYDVQPINLRDVLVNRVVAPQGPGTSPTDPKKSPRAPLGSIVGALPARNTANPHLDLSAITEGGTCTKLPGEIPPAVAQAVMSSLTTGLYRPLGLEDCGNVRVGGTHANATGYITIDVVSTCSMRFPDDENYYRADLLYDNVLIGEYQQVYSDSVRGNFAQGNPMVHIRAIPEGGRTGEVVETNLPYTFYDRYTPAALRQLDRRQPLPAQFAVRWIEGGAGAFNTDLKVWREGVTTGNQSCGKAVNNADMPIAHVIRFDERENSFGYSAQLPCLCPILEPALPATSRVNTAYSVFPLNAGPDVGGWLYLNINNRGSAGYSRSRGDFAPSGSNTIIRPSQNWVVTSMYAEGKYGVDYDAMMLANGCTPAIGPPSFAAPVGPAANATP